MAAALMNKQSDLNALNLLKRQTWRLVQYNSSMKNLHPQ